MAKSCILFFGDRVFDALVWDVVLTVTVKFWHFFWHSHDCIWYVAFSLRHISDIAFTSSPWLVLSNVPLAVLEVCNSYTHKRLEDD